MDAILQKETLSDIESEIINHPSWLGEVSGLKAEKLLKVNNRNKTPYVYVLRAGENNLDYYVTFFRPDGVIEHRPFAIMLSPEGWYYENTGGGGPYRDASIEDVLHSIMHCEKGENRPLVNFEKKCF
jgi:hypothetical protein